MKVINLHLVFFQLLLVLGGCVKNPPDPEPEAPGEASCWKIDMTNIDFSKDRVYSASADGKTVALVTKEYLGDALGKQAILVYTLDNEGNWKTDSIAVPVVTLVQKGKTFVAPEECVSGGTLKYYDMEKVYFYNNISEAHEVPATAVFIKMAADGSTFVKYESTTKESAVIRPVTLSLDGYDYSLVKIAGKIWTAENIRAKRYADGQSIAQSGQWSDYSSNWINSSNAAAGVLYNAYALGFTAQSKGDIVSRLAPDGWRLPSAGSLGDWNDIVDFLPDARYAQSPHHNVSGLSVVPSGRMNTNGTMKSPDEDDCIFWSSTADPEDPTKAYFAKIYYLATAGDLIRCTSTTNRRPGFAVRLVKDF